MFTVFNRTWWKQGPAGLEPDLGERHVIAHVRSESEARAIARAWNEAHDPGPLSNKAEYTEGRIRK